MAIFSRVMNMIEYTKADSAQHTCTLSDADQMLLATADDARVEIQLTNAQTGMVDLSVGVTCNGKFLLEPKVIRVYTYDIVHLQGLKAKLQMTMVKD